ncbi:ectoine/hydroxyectoine ABC transporter permease subunit EhuC [Alsobacter sp. SYSU M60028]|uniref:Ectoine/hydroxyectoine ABC transporter permease subunit EhuC n=1 Tax=Alsobacter ponti TaxID=2962936 RepID=A0ABT1LHL4_9HYPH|nr:ectoine/hydroxyectoine ABC transporter permease subunit EhuC [Alsobacter ponti]MCP8940995.1 ectoine/hydroxyectoine ABC transporter permease subunit EhuC [Alsobacter ponti]
MAGESTFVYLPYLMGGVVTTLQITALAMLLALPVSFLLALGRMSSFAPARWGAGFVIELFRGTSAVVQLFWAFYVLPFFGVELSPLAAGVLVLGLNEGSYFSEVVRASLKSIVAGQREAAVALHLPRFYTFRRIVLPQALPIMVPPFGNAAVLMLKFTALTSLVTIQELSFRAGLLRSNLGVSSDIYGVVLAIYFALAVGMASLVWLAERAVNRWAGREVIPWRELTSRRASPAPKWAFRR